MEQKGVLGKWADRITLSGLIEGEAYYEAYDYDDPTIKDEDSSDITLATVELGVDVDIIKHVKGHVLFKLYIKKEGNYSACFMLILLFAS